MPKIFVDEVVESVVSHIKKRNSVEEIRRSNWLY